MPLKLSYLQGGRSFRRPAILWELYGKSLNLEVLCNLNCSKLLLRIQYEYYTNKHQNMTHSMHVSVLYMGFPVSMYERQHACVSQNHDLHPVSVCSNEFRTLLRFAHLPRNSAAYIRNLYATFKFAVNNRTFQLTFRSA